MNLHQLECFIEVAETLSFTKAAQNLYISQTAVTNHIKHLEESIGFALFERDKKRVSVTKDGAVFLAAAYKVIEAANACQNTVRLLKEGAFGEISLAYIKGIEQDILIDILGNFYEKNPLTQFHLFNGKRIHIKKMLLQKEVDGIFTYSPDFSDEYEKLRIRSYPLVAAVSKKHPLAVQSSLSYHELREETNLVFDSSQPEIAAPDLNSTLLKIAINSCTAVVPEFIMNYTQYTKYINFIPVSDCRRTFEIFFIYKKSNKNPAFLNFLNALQLSVTT